MDSAAHAAIIQGKAAMMLLGCSHAAACWRQTLKSTRHQLVDVALTGSTVLPRTRLGHELHGGAVEGELPGRQPGVVQQLLVGRLPAGIGRRAA